MRLLLSSSADQPSPNIDPAAAEMLSAQLHANKVRCMCEVANGDNGNGRTYGRKCAVLWYGLVLLVLPFRPPLTDTEAAVAAA